MFFFKKNSPFLKDIIPNNYIDIHSHLLPGIDDGAKSITDSLLLINELKKIGFIEFITTPHVIKDVWNNTNLSITSKLNSTNIELEKVGIPSIKAAAEYMLDSNFVLLFQSEKLLTLKDNYILVEMSYLAPPIQLYDIIFELQVAGYKPVLAHPERYNFYHNSLEDYKKLKKSGCLFQLNLLSSVGYYGSNVASSAEFLLKNGLIDFVGSDVHHMKHVDFFDKKIVLKNPELLKEIFQNNLFFKS